MKLTIYAHYGSQNHGNEAIVRGIARIFEGHTLTVISDTPEKDKQFGLNDTADIVNSGAIPNRLTALFRAVIRRITGSNKLILSSIVKPILKMPVGLYLMEAGDQYCEGKDLLEKYAYLNGKLRKRGIKTVAYACSIKESTLTNKKALADLKAHSLIISRESTTYNLLLKNGFTNVVLSSCPAFAMKPLPCALPSIFDSGKVIGVTIGYVGQGMGQYNEALLSSTVALIKHIIEDTDCSVALIPHVNANETLTDMPFLYDLFNIVRDTGRIIMMPEQRADIQKYVISSCKMIITVRTHVSIAAYSSCIPTLVIGYSVKSFALAKDIFGTDEGFVYRLDEIENQEKLIAAFDKIYADHDIISQHLSKVMPEYISHAYEMREKVLALMEE